LAAACLVNATLAAYLSPSSPAATDYLRPAAHRRTRRPARARRPLPSPWPGGPLPPTSPLLPLPRRPPPDTGFLKRCLDSMSAGRPACFPT